MPVQYVELHGFHSIEVALDDLDRHKVARDIDEQAAPGKTGLVVDGKRGQCKSLGANVYQLQQRLQPMQHPQRIRGIQSHASGRDLQAIRFLFSQRLDLRSGSATMNN